MLKKIIKNNVLGNPIRFGIMLYLLPRGKSLFIEIQRALEITPGNLDSHLKTLQRHGYVKIRKVIKDRPRTAVFITGDGAENVKKYVKSLKEALEESAQTGNI